MIKSRRMRWAGYVGEEECIQGIDGKARRLETKERPRHKWVHNIKLDLTGIGSGGMDWIDLAWDRDQ
jgi:hypothetical protein